MIALLVAYIFHATVNRIMKVEEDFHKMEQLKKKAEAADIAKSQVCYISEVLCQTFHQFHLFCIHGCNQISTSCSSLLPSPMRSEPQ